jgi:hypothetical protein
MMDSLYKPTGSEFLEDKASLDRLTQTDLVSQDHPRCYPVRHPMGHEDLVRRRLNASVRQARHRVIPVCVIQNYLLKTKTMKLGIAQLAVD